ncbi:MAG: hypothetical protein ACK5LY_02610 [Lachnospirales bacterium]
MKKRKGASSIIVLFMVVVLITIGLFTILSADLNFKLSQKADSWNSTYYEVDTLCEVKLSELDSILLQSEQEAIDFLLSQDFSVVNLRYTGYELLNQTYKSIVIEKLNEYCLEDSFSYIDVVGDDVKIDTITYFANVQSPSVENYEIQMEVLVNDISYDGYGTFEKIYNQERYDIIKWKQNQVFEDISSDIEIWIPDEELEIEIVD